MEYSPPPFFKRGPAPLVRLLFFASLSLALLVVDARFRYAEALRQTLALVAYPLQRVATAPIDFLTDVGTYFSTQARLVGDNASLKEKVLALSQDAQRYQAAQAELDRLRRLVGAAERVDVKSTVAEIIYAERDPYAHKVFISVGAQQGITAGSPVADEAGIIGQITRVYPLLSEVTLITDQDQAIPVQVVRTGRRTIAFGSGPSGMLELRFMSVDAEIQNDDQLVTSGLDGRYPPGVPVATVVRIERDAELSLTRVLCKPAGGVDRGRYVLVLSNLSTHAPLPPEAQPSSKQRRAEKAKAAKAATAPVEKPKPKAKAKAKADNAAR